jgi:protein-S-isoprenylcysteine O-methyltransferase Ste14
VNIHDVGILVGDLWRLSGVNAGTMLSVLWSIFGLYWLVSALSRKKTKKRESIAQRLLYMLPLIVAFWLLFNRAARTGWLATRLWHDRMEVAWIGVLLTACGIAIACWARYHLGTNWSGVVTLKEGHELIRTGPYRNIRHPIYTGMLLAILGSAVTVGEVRALLAFVIAWLSFYIKARREESFLSHEFGAGFIEHQRHTGMFLPRLC